MARFNREWLNHPALNRVPRSDSEQREFVRVLLDALEGAVSNINDEGRITEASALPATIVLNRASALVGNTSPLTATDAGPAASINIAAHTIQTGDTQIAYDAGSVNGLSYSTTYFVYAQDADLVGGSVTYLATETPADIVSSNDNYYVGKITTPAALGADTSGGSGGAAGGTEDSGPAGIWP